MGLSPGKQLEHSRARFHAKPSGKRLAGQAAHKKKPGKPGSRWPGEGLSCGRRVRGGP